MSEQEERESNVIARAKVEITVNDFHEWVRARALGVFKINPKYV